jgi:hypothetical protein
MGGLIAPEMALPDELLALSASVNEPVLPTLGTVSCVKASDAGLAGAALDTGVGETEGLTVPATLSEHAASPRIATITTIRDLSRLGRIALKGGVSSSNGRTCLKAANAAVQFCYRAQARRALASAGVAAGPAGPPGTEKRAAAATVEKFNP